MSSLMDATPSTIHHECRSCHMLHPISICYCDAELCEACTPGHLALCAYAKVRQFKTWKPATVRRLT